MSIAPSPALDFTPRVLLVIPAFNNRATLACVVREALATGLPVLVVNDGSRDGGPEMLMKMLSETSALEIFDLPTNQGKGAAILAAATWAEARGFSHLITIDADGQHRPNEAARFIEKIAARPWSVVTGVRDFASVAAPGSSRFGRRFSNFWIKVATGISNPDSQSGFRAYPVAALRRLRCRARRYDFEVEVLVRAAWAGLRLEAVPVSVAYPERRVSHFRAVRDNARISWVYTRCITRQLLPWPHKKLPSPFGDAEPAGLSLRHPWRTLKLLIEESSSPGELATAAMLGIFLGTLPLIACHSAVILFAATRLRLNRLLALNVSHFCAPPFVPALAIEAGYFLRHGEWLTRLDMQTLGREAPQRLLDYLLGALAVGPLLAAAAGLLAYALAHACQRARKKAESA